MPKRCSWSIDDGLMQDYHDHEWGVPTHEENLLFEFILLEGMQAGLSWMTILNKRENFRKAFDQFDPVKISKYHQNKIDALLQNAGIIRNKLKINGAIKNAKAFLSIQKQFGSFDKYIWQFTDGATIKNKFKSIHEIPATTFQSDNMSEDLKKMGFTFVGSTICYAFMQSCGMVNDHVVTCFRYNDL